MKLFQNKKKTTLIALFLMMTIAATLITLPIATSHDPPWNNPTYAYVTCTPDTVNIGGYSMIVMFLDRVPPTAGGASGDRWFGFKLDITKPDGSKEQLGPFTSDPVGTYWVDYKPDQVGDYNIVFSWPGQVATNGTGQPNERGLMWVGDYFEPSTSAPIKLHVQKEPIATWAEPMLPDYWSRPIHSANREWSSLASNWLEGSWFRYSAFQEQGRAPNTPHIIWQKSITTGGIVDARWPGVSPLTSPESVILMNGRIYLNEPGDDNSARYGYYSFDLLTGEQIWYKNGTDNGLNNPVSYVGYGTGVNIGPELYQEYPQLSFGQLLQSRLLNAGGGIFSYLWMTVGSTWYMLDPDTGDWIMTLKNVPGGTAVTDQDGNLLRYSYSSSTGKILAWNSTQAIPPPGPTGTSQQRWGPRIGSVIDAVNDTSWTVIGPVDGKWTADDIRPRSGYTMNVTGPKGLPGLSRVLQDEKNVPKTLFFNNMRNSPIAGSSDMFFQAAAIRIDYHVAPYSPLPDKTSTQNNNLGYGVSLLWNKTITKPLGGNLTWNLHAVSYEEGVFTIRAKETMQLWGYSLADGSLLWGPTAAQPAWNMYGIGAYVAYGKLFTEGYAGILHCYDLKSGKLLWNYTAQGIGYESPYGDYPLNVGAIADGKIFVYSTEHSPTRPLWRGSYVRCINATNGQEIWKILNWGEVAIADGYIVTSSLYDNKITCIGKGPSATTVTAPEDAQPFGSSVLIRGSVTDQSTGAKGTPAIADSDQQAWMEYIYMQQTKPANPTGVKVHLTATDPNGNFQDIGYVTTDISGNYGKSWNPPVPGTYQVKATYEGSESYGTSFATSYFTVNSAASVAPIVTQTPIETGAPSSSMPSIQPTSPAPTSSVIPPTFGTSTTTFVAISAAVIIIVAAAAALVLRKRKK